jgi:cation transport ATPase
MVISAACWQPPTPCVQEVPRAIAAVLELGIQQVELLTGDNDRTAAALVESLTLGSQNHKPLQGLRYRANLLPKTRSPS